MAALAKARQVSAAKRKEAKRLGILLSEVQYIPPDFEIQVVPIQAPKENQKTNYRQQKLVR